MKLLRRYIDFIYRLGVFRSFVLAANLSVVVGFSWGLCVIVARGFWFNLICWPALFCVFAAAGSLVLIWKDRPRRK